MKIRVLFMTLISLFFCFFLFPSGGRRCQALILTGEFFSRFSETLPINRDVYLGVYAIPLFREGELS
jgi:hypothetical protein